MGIFVGIKFDEETTNAIVGFQKTIQQSHPSFKPIHRANLHAPLAFSRTEARPKKPYQPLGSSIKQRLVFKNPRIEFLGENNPCIELTFECEWFNQQYNKLISEYSFRQRHPFKPRIPLFFIQKFYKPSMSHFANVVFFEELYVESDVVNFFDPDFPSVAHEHPRLLRFMNKEGREETAYEHQAWYVQNYNPNFAHWLTFPSGHPGQPPKEDRG